MSRITLQQFLVNQPSFPEPTATDEYYLHVAQQLMDAAMRSRLPERWPEEVIRSAALVATGYFQDVVADAGIWRGFINECRRLYGRSLPFYDTAEEYIDYELNPEDVRFVAWYALAMLYEHRRDTSPMDEEVMRVAEKWYDLLEGRYEEAPHPEEFHLTHELEIHDIEEQERIARLGHWLYLHCWLLRPANALTLSEILADLPEGEEGHKEMMERLNRAMNELPTGPLALYTREWLYLVAEDRMPPKSRAEKMAEREMAERPDHSYYTSFTKATGGERIAFFADYAELNRFFIEGLGWAQGEEHLAQLRDDRDFVLFVDPKKGMLLAKNIARCIAYPSNTLYDQDYARLHAIELLTVRGRCPFDLLKFVCEGGWLPDASFPGKERDTALVAANWDFIARCYLQQYYRGD